MYKAWRNILMKVLAICLVAASVASCAHLALAADNPTPPTTGGDKDGGSGKTDYNPCSRLSGGGYGGSAAAEEACRKCMGDDDDNPVGFWTAIGCIPTEPLTAAGQLVTLMVGVGALFVVIQILIGSFQLVVSRGNPQALQAARERIINSIVALLFVVFAGTILEFFGVTVLHLPGFFDNSNNTSSSNSGSNSGGDNSQQITSCRAQCQAQGKAYNGVSADGTCQCVNK